MAKEEQIQLNVYGQDFKLRVVPREKELLRKAAGIVEQRMEEIASSGVVSLHRVAMLAAIDIAFQAILHLPEMRGEDLDKAQQELDTIHESIEGIITKIDNTLEQSVSEKGGKKGGGKRK